MNRTACVLFVFGLAATAATGARAGDVEAVVVNGTLRVTGSSGADVVAISGPMFEVSSAAPGTTINGQAYFLPEGVTKDVRIELGVGDDQLTFGGLSLPRDVRIDLGVGIDSLVMTAVAPARDLAIVDAQSWKTLDLENVQVGEDLTMKLGDQLFFGNIKMNGVTVGDRTKITAGTDGATLSDFESCNFGGRVTLHLGSGNEDVQFPGNQFQDGIRCRFDGALGVFNLYSSVVTGSVRVESHGGTKLHASVSDTSVSGDVVVHATSHDAIFGTNATIYGDCRMNLAADGAASGGIATAHVYGDVRCITGSGDDSLAFDQVEVGGALRVNTGAGDDEVVVANVNVGKTRFALGAGSDLLDFSWPNQFDRLDVIAGTGDDQFQGGSPQTVAQDARLLMGGGDNGVWLPNSLVGGDLRVVCGNGDDVVGLTGTNVIGKKSVKTGGGTDFVE